VPFVGPLGPFVDSVMARGGERCYLLPNRDAVGPRWYVVSASDARRRKATGQNPRLD